MWLTYLHSTPSILFVIEITRLKFARFCDSQIVRTRLFFHISLKFEFNFEHLNQSKRNEPNEWMNSTDNSFWYIFDRRRHLPALWLNVTFDVDALLRPVAHSRWSAMYTSSSCIGARYAQFSDKTLDAVGWCHRQKSIQWMRTLSSWTKTNNGCKM